MSPNRREARALLRLAGPAISTQLGSMTLGLVDNLMIARLGTEALAATTLGTLWVFGTLHVAYGVLMGLDPLVAQAHGAHDEQRVGSTLRLGVIAAVIASLPLAVLWLFTGTALRALGQDPELAAIAHSYTVAQVVSIPFGLAFGALRQWLSGRGVLAPAMWVTWLANVLNIFLNWVLIFGHLGATPRGVVGSAIATAVARIFMLVALVALALLSREADLVQSWRRGRATLAGVFLVLRTGAPVGIQMGLEIWAFHIMTLMAGLIDATALAAHSIVLSVASFTFMVPLGISIAGTIRVGHAIGAGDSVGARRAGWLSLAMGVAFMTASAISFLLFRFHIPRLWDPETGVLELAARILPIAAAFQVFDGIQVVGCGVLRGAGDTRPATWFNLIGYYLLAVPVGAWLCFAREVGLPGLWIGLLLGLASVAALLVWRISASLGRAGVRGPDSVPR